MSAEYPRLEADIVSLASAIGTGEAKAITALSHVAGALAVRLEDQDAVALEPWVALIGRLAPHANAVAGVLRFLLYLFLQVVKPMQNGPPVGLAARALLADSFSRDDPGIQVVNAIGFVADTFDTEPGASKALLAKVFEPDRFAANGWEEIPALCRKIDTLAAGDPRFAAEIYAKTYALDVSDERVTNMGGSRILSMTSNARQDFDMARYSLSEFFPKFLERHPVEATDALIGAMSGYVERENKSGDDAETTWEVAGQVVRLVSDGSHVWAHDPEGQYARDAEALLVKFTNTLRTLDTDLAMKIAGRLVERSGLAVLWSRILLVAAARNDAVADFLWPFAASEALIVEPDTRKDAVDLIAAAYPRRTQTEKAGTRAGCPGLRHVQVRRSAGRARRPSAPALQRHRDRQSHHGHCP